MSIMFIYKLVPQVFRYLLTAILPPIIIIPGRRPSIFLFQVTSYSVHISSPRPSLLTKLPPTYDTPAMICLS
jgi:hypothetical protein